MTQPTRVIQGDRTVTCEFDWMKGHADRQVVAGRLEANYVPLLLKHNRPKTEWWYETPCCGQRVTMNNPCLKESDWRLIWALEHWDELLTVASERGMVPLAFGAT